jgi:2-polyprenyl-3-methyl-5-hydroxy-6-metoxy-1,4-benzoquinol methylase
VSAEDRIRWDRRYASWDGDRSDVIGLPVEFDPYAEHFPTAGCALDIACGRGAAAMWLARRGMTVWGYDISPVAISQAGALARQHGLAEGCRFAVADLDAGLPSGASADVIVCSKFRDSGLDAAIAERLAPGGLLAISALGTGPGGSARFGVRPGELRRAFTGLEVIAAGDTWLLARKR